MATPPRASAPPWKASAPTSVHVSSVKNANRPQGDRNYFQVLMRGSLAVLFARRMPIVNARDQSGIGKRKGLTSTGKRKGARLASLGGRGRVAGEKRGGDTARL